MTRIEVNKHAEIIKGAVYHTFPYNMLVPNFKGPHAEDCPGCIIEAELKILVDKIAELSPTEDIIEELEEEKRKNKAHVEDRTNALARAGLGDAADIDLVELVGSLVDERDRLTGRLDMVLNELNSITRMLKGSADA